MTASRDAYTPPHLVEGVLTNRAAMEGERKQVTVLFCDLAGSTALAERLGPEAMHGLLEQFFELALAEVHRYQGTINQFLGDGFMALFGAPLAREDHARRAVLAALGLQQALRERHEAAGGHGAEGLGVRIGINTGMVVVGKIGDHLRMDYTAVGDTTNVAGRLEQLAEPGSILVGESTGRLIEGYVRLEALPPTWVKGKATPITAFRVLGPGSRRSRLEGVTEETLTAFVGRKRELLHLEELLGRAAASEGQVLGIVGEPGMGKSRLLREFRRQAEQDVVWLEGHCLPYGQAIPYHPILDIVRTSCAIADGDTPEAIAIKVHGGAKEAGLDAAAAAPYLLHLLGVKEGTESLSLLSPEAIKARSVDLLRRMMLRGNGRRPLVLAIEDLHWIDGASEEFAASLVERIVGAPVLLVFTYRPGYRPPWMEHSYATQIALGHLSADDSRAVLRQALGARDLPEPLAQAMLERASGNPLFIEELARTAGEGGEARSAIPATIQDVLSARIDRLAEPPRRLLQAASVVGREVSTQILSAIWKGPGDLAESLRELTHAEFLQERPGSVEPTYVFKHALIQEITYEGLLERHRRAGHGQVGRALEELYAGRIDEVVELLAHHFGRSDDAERAVDYAITAAEKAQRRWANAEALGRFDTALVRLDAMPASEANRIRRIDAVVRQAEVKFALGRHAEHRQALEAIGGLVESTADPRRRAAWHYWRGFLASLTGGRLEAAMASCREAAAIAAAGGFEDIRGFADCCLAQTYTVAGDLGQAIAAGERALATFEARRNVWWACRALWVLSAAANAAGEWARSLGYCQRALSHAIAVDDLRLRVSALLRTGSTHIQRGDPAAGIEQCQGALALSPIPFDAAALKAIRGYGLVKAGEAAAGTAALTEARSWYELSHLRYTRSLFGLWLAEGHLRLGDMETARAVVTEVLSTSRELGYRHFEGVAHRLMAECAEPADADRHLETALPILEAVGARNELGRALVARAELDQRRGQDATARQGLARALDLFDALGTLDEPRRARAALAELDGLVTL